MGATVTKTDFEWSYTQEPHASRRKEMLKKYPNMKKLMVHDPNIKYIVIAAVTFQLFMSYMIQNASWVTLICLAYCLGGTINHSMSLAIHEISHNLAFGHTKPFANRIIGFIANIPIGVPVSISFRKYHLEHHRYQGDDKMDVDIPSRLEGKLFTNTFTKLLWVLLQPWFYAIRPLVVRPKPVEMLELANFILQLSVDITIVYFWSFKALAYLIIGTFLATGLHPMAGHFISEHYVFKKGYETYSYYGPLNYLTFNVGYHNEHHDFPSIPGCNLPLVKSMNHIFCSNLISQQIQLGRAGLLGDNDNVIATNPEQIKVRKIAPEYYDNLPYHTSWVKVIWDFITDPEIGPYARVKRATKSVNTSEVDSDVNEDGVEEKIEKSE